MPCFTSYFWEYHVSSCDCVWYFSCFCWYKEHDKDLQGKDKVQLFQTKSQEEEMVDHWSCFVASRFVFYPVWKNEKIDNKQNKRKFLSKDEEKMIFVALERAHDHKQQTNREKTNKNRNSETLLNLWTKESTSKLWCWFHFQWTYAGLMRVVVVVRVRHRCSSAFLCLCFFLFLLLFVVDCEVVDGALVCVFFCAQTRKERNKQKCHKKRLPKRSKERKTINPRPQRRKMGDSVEGWRDFVFCFLFFVFCFLFLVLLRLIQITNQQICHSGGLLSRTQVSKDTIPENGTQQEGLCKVGGLFAKTKQNRRNSKYHPNEQRKKKRVYFSMFR